MQVLNAYMYRSTLAYRYQSLTNELISAEVPSPSEEKNNITIYLLKLVSFLQMSKSFEIFVLQLQDKSTTADAYLNKPSSIYLPPPKVHNYALWMTYGWPGPFLILIRISLSICLLEAWDHNLFFFWCKCI